MPISPRSSKREASLLAPDLMARVRAIQIRTHRLVNTALSGGYRSTFRGQGIEFQEVRPYQPGDEVRSIDWNVTARTGETFVKTYAEERELTLELAVDVGVSMDFGSRRWTKREAAAQLAALLAYVAIQHQDRVGMTLFAGKPELHLPSRKGAKHILRIVREVIAARTVPEKTDLTALCEQELRTLHRRSLVFLISDFLDDGAREPSWRESLARLAARHDVIALRLVDPLERELPSAGILAMQRLGDSQRMELDTRSARVRQSWAEREAARRARLAEIFARSRVEWMDIPIEADIADPLVAFFRRRNKRHGVLR